MLTYTRVINGKYFVMIEGWLIKWRVNNFVQILQNSRIIARDIKIERMILIMYNAYPYAMDAIILYAP